MARGIVGSVGGGESYRDTVASPMYKQVFDLVTGECLTEPGERLPVWPVRVVEDQSRSAQVGRAAAYRESPMTELGPVLAGCRILVTAQRRADELAGALASRGAESRSRRRSGWSRTSRRRRCSSRPGRSSPTRSTSWW